MTARPRLPIFAAMDAAPSEQLGNPSQLHTLAIVYSTDEATLMDCVRAMHEQVPTDHFVVNQYRRKGDRLQYAHFMLQAIQHEFCKRNFRVFLITHRASEIVASVDQMFTTLQLSGWCSISGTGTSRRVTAPAVREMPTHCLSEELSLPYHQGIMVLWIGFALRLVQKHLDEQAQANHYWHIVSDHIAGDRETAHPRATLLSACLRRFKDDLELHCSTSKDTCMDLADTFAGMARDCLNNIGNPEWDGVRQAMVDTSEINWGFKTSPPWEQAQPASE